MILSDHTNHELLSLVSIRARRTLVMHDRLQLYKLWEKYAIYLATADFLTELDRSKMLAISGDCT